MAFEFLASGDAAGADGIFFPASDLPGVDAAELTGADSDALKQGKATMALVEALVLGLAAAAPLGLTVSKASPAGAGANLFNQGYTMQWQKLVNLSDNSLGMIPLPTAGANAGNGGVAVADLYPNAATLAAGAAAPADGISIPAAELASYGAPAFSGLNLAAGQDNRSVLAALFEVLSSSETRSATVESAITTAAKSTPASSAIPAALTAATDPTSGIAAADAPQRSLLSRNNTVSVQVELNPETQSFDARSVTA